MNESGKQKPAVLLAGGRPSNAVDTARLLSHAYGVVEKPLVAYIGAASGDSLVFHKMMKSTLMKAGAGKVVFVRLAKDKVNVDAAKKVLSSADVIYFSGGEVEDGINWLKKHGLVDYIKELYNEGKQMVGVSAGAIMLGSHWVRWDDPKDDTTAELFDCLGIVPEIFDTHAEDEDWIELKTALKLMGEGAKGYGLPAGGAISADKTGKLVNLEKEYLTFINEKGEVRRKE